jgi:homoserine dehydrogenase
VKVVAVANEKGEVADPQLLAAAERVHLQLRPHLAGNYVPRMREVIAAGAEMAVALDRGDVLGVACLPHGGAHLLRTRDVLRRPRDRRDPALDGRGPRAHGAHALAVRGQACDAFTLDSGVQRGQAHKFYFREGMTVTSFHFTQVLSDRADRPEAQVKPIYVGLLGLGTVGSGTIEVLRRNREEISRRAGRDIVIKVAGARDLKKERGVSLEGIELVQRAGEIVARPDIDIVVELIGGETDARELVLKAIEAGKHVVTANKALLARHGTEIFSAAHRKGVMVAFEASVAGGIPIIKAIREGLSANRIEWIAGIINGTCNYILTEMRDKGLPFDMVLAEAQRLGYAEADPAFDVEGIDAAHKLTILAAIAFGIPMQFDKVYTEGISKLTALDIKYAEGLGYRIKLLGITRRTKEGIELRVHPTLIPARRLIANVEGVMNAVLVKGDAVGPRCTTDAAPARRPRRAPWWPTSWT